MKVKVQQVIAGLVLVVGMSAGGVQAQSSEAVLPLVKDINARSFARDCGKVAASARAYDRSNGSEARFAALVRALEQCSEFSTKLGDDLDTAFKALYGEEDDGEFEDERAPLTAAGFTKNTSAVGTPQTSTGTKY